MEQDQPQTDQIYVVTESLRQAILTIIRKAVHPNLSYEQVGSVLTGLETLQPVQVMRGVIPDEEPLAPREPSGPRIPGTAEQG